MMDNFNVEEWAKGLDLNKDSRDILQSEGLDDPHNIVELTEADLKEMGIKQMGQRKALLRGVSQLRESIKPITTSVSIEAQPVTTNLLAKDTALVKKIQEIQVNRSASNLFGRVNRPASYVFGGRHLCMPVI